MDNCCVIDNRDIVTEAVKDVWFRRSIYVRHCFIKEPLENLIKNFEILNSEQIFYNVIEQVIMHVEDPNDRWLIFSYM